MGCAGMGPDLALASVPRPPAGEGRQGAALSGPLLPEQRFWLWRQNGSPTGLGLRCGLRSPRGKDGTV